MCELNCKDVDKNAFNEKIKGLEDKWPGME